MSVQMGTFSQFTTARLAIYASQSSLSVTGNNIANINTKGYTRQRMDLVSLYPTGEARYANNYNLSIGYGVLCDSVSQLRDPFLDIRYRNENASLGAYNAKLSGLQQLAQKLDEVGKGNEGFGVIEDQIEDLIQQLQSWNGLTGITEYDDQVRASADQLCKLFNTTAKGLQEIYDNEVKYLEQNVTKANSLLTKIRDLNEQIRAHNIYGDSALELKDARNVAIDELSSLMKINVTYSMERIDEFTEVEKLTITLPGTVDPAFSKVEAMEQAVKDNKDNLNAAGKTALAGAADDKAIADILANEAYYDVAGYPKTWQDYNVSSNFDKPIKLIDGIYGTQFNIKKEYTLNPKYQPMYLDVNGNPTDNIDLAGVTNGKPTMNKDHQGKYMLAPGKDNIYGNGTTDNIDDAATDPVTQAVQYNEDYQAKYLDAYGDPTDDLEKADYVYDDKFLMDIDPLTDRRGKYMRDSQYGVQLKASVDLKDNDLFGAIQSMRELLTEEGTFTSNYELGRDLDEITDPDERHRAELIADPNGSSKRGIPYYMKVLDNLAQQLARDINSINQPSKYASGVDSIGMPIFADGLTMDMIYKVDQPADGQKAEYEKYYKTENGGFVDKDGKAITNPVTNAPLVPTDVEYAKLNPNVLHADFASKTAAELIVKYPGYFASADPNDATAEELKAAQLADQANEITNAKTALAALEKDGVPLSPTFVDKDGNSITVDVALPNGTTEKRPLTLDDVKYANLDPVKRVMQQVPKLDNNNNPVFDKDGNPVMEEVPLFNSMEDQIAAIQAAQKNMEKLREQGVLTDEWNFYQGGALISNNGNSNDPTGITASNISVALDWAKGSVRVLNTVQPNDVYYNENGVKQITTHSTAGDNILHMIASLNSQHTFEATDIDADSASTSFYFRGTFHEMFTNISGTLALDQNETQSQCNLFDLSTLDLENSRQSISGVDLNEEATNMMQFQKSFSAACQLLTIIDSMLDKLINGTI